MNEVQAIEKMKLAAVERMRTMPAAERELVLNELLVQAGKSMLSDTYPALVRLHGDLMRIHNAMCANERMNAMTTTPRPPVEAQPFFVPPPPAPTPLYSDAQFRREQQRGMLAFGMILGGTGALVAALFIAPVPTSVVIGAVLVGRYIMEPKPDKAPPQTGSGQHIHYHYYNTQNIHHEKQG